MGSPGGVLNHTSMRSFEERMRTRLEHSKENSSEMSSACGGNTNPTANLVTNSSRTDPGGRTRMVKAPAASKLSCKAEDFAGWCRESGSFAKVWGFDTALTREIPIKIEDIHMIRDRVEVLGCTVEEFDEAINA